MVGTSDEALYLVFRQGPERYAVPLEGVNEVLEPVPLGFVPQAPEVCLGVFTHHGQVLSAVDGARLFGDGSAAVGEAPTGGGTLTRLVVLSYGDIRFALQVDRVDRIAPLTSVVRPAAGGGPGEKWIEGVYPEPDGVVNKIDMAAFAEEVDRLFQPSLGQ